MTKKSKIGRRNFLKNSVFGIIGAGLISKTGWASSGRAEQAPELKIKEYRMLGRTGYEVSDLSVGFVQDEGMLNAMFDAGVNFVDTAESYPGDHKIIGKAIKGRDRKSVFIATKMLLDEGDGSKEGILRRTQKALEELDTGYVDCMMIHAPETVEILKHENFHSAMKQLKTEGRVKHLGVSHHGSFWFRDSKESMDKVLPAAVEDGRFDVFLMAYNFLKIDGSEKVLEACREKKVGVALMKTTPVAKYYALKSRIEQMEKDGKEIHPLYKDGLTRFQDKAERAEKFIKKYNLEDPEEIRMAAIRFVLSNPSVSTVCCSLRTFDEMERILSLSGQKLSDLDKGKLAAYREGCGDLYCRHACGVCEPACPHGVPVNTIMRYNHYFMAQRREKEAMAKYAQIPGVKADKCTDCPGHCEKACPYNVAIQGMLLLAHDQLTLG